MVKYLVQKSDESRNILYFSRVRSMIGERLKDVRKDHGDTQTDLAKKLNVSLSTVKSWERGNSAPSHELLVAICKLYQVSSDFLLGLNNDDPLLSSNVQEKLSPQNRALVRLFEEFILYKQQKEAKK